MSSRTAVPGTVGRLGVSPHCLKVDSTHQLCLPGVEGRRTTSCVCVCVVHTYVWVYGCTYTRRSRSHTPANGTLLGVPFTLLYWSGATLTQGHGHRHPYLSPPPGRSTVPLSNRNHPETSSPDRRPRPRHTGEDPDRDYGPPQYTHVLFRSFPD